MQDLIQMLKEYEIKNVISIDDGWSVAESLKDKLEMRKVSENTTIREYCDEFLFEVIPEEKIHYENIKDELIKDIESFEGEIPNLYADICENLGVIIDSALKNLRTVFDKISMQEKINIYYDVEFKGTYQTMQGNTLYILDKNMGDGKEDAVIQYILKIIEERKDYKDLVIVYSGEVKDLLTHSKKLDYLEKCNVGEEKLSVLYQFWPLDKTIDEVLLIGGIKKMFSKSAYGKALSKMIANKRLSISKAFADVIQIDIDNLDDMIIESYIEGGKITESYEMLIDSLIRRNEFNMLATSELLTYEKGLLQYEEMRAKEILSEQGIKNEKKYKQFRKSSLKKKVIDSVHKEGMLFNIADYSVNQEYSDPAMGDIYILTDARNNKRCAGMLISQECSTIIRKIDYEDKARRSANELLLLLFDIVEITESNIGDRIINKLENCIWPIKICNKICLLEITKKSMYVKPELLDLCGMNPDGRANIAFDKNVLEYKSVYAKEYYEDFKQKVEQKIEDVVRDVMNKNEIKRKDVNIRNMIVSLAYGVVYKNDFELQRVCRLDEKQSLHIIHEYLNSIGKIGLPIAPNL